LIHTHLLPTSLGELGINRAVAVGRRHAQIDQRPRRVDIGGFGGHAIREARRKREGRRKKRGDTQKKLPVISKNWGIYTFNGENLI